MNAPETADRSSPSIWSRWCSTTATSRLQKLEWALVLLAVAAFGGRTFPRAWNSVNTDFPNYYIVAHLVREGSSPDRAYEWKWIQRQKNRLGIQQSVVGYIPLTPFSALPIRPLTSHSALGAKRLWTVINIGLLTLILGFIHSITTLGLRRLLLLALLSFPVHQNLLLGQEYIVLLCLLTLALWLHIRDHNCLAGVLVGLASGLKIFPVLFILYFLRKRQWNGILGIGIGIATAILVSIALFGIEMNRLYLTQVLPRALRGEAADPYNLQANSISALLHHLFILEPALNPHPLLNQPLLFAVLHPVIQLLIFAPALLLLGSGKLSPQRTKLEWSAFTLAIITISTSPALYDFAILLLPAAVILSILVQQREWRLLGLYIVLYLAVGYPYRNPHQAGLIASLFVPRLYALIAMCALGCWLLFRDSQTPEWRRNRYAWTAALGAGLAVTITGNVLHHRAMYGVYQWRLQIPVKLFSSSQPVSNGESTFFTAMTQSGYRIAELHRGSLRISSSQFDQLAQSSVAGRHWIELSSDSSTIVSDSSIEILDAELPVASQDGRWLAYLKRQQGRARLWLRDLRTSEDSLISPAELDVLEMAFGPDNSLLISAKDKGVPRLFRVNRDRPIALSHDAARYPAVSPDGRWLAYSRLRGGAWNLWLRDLHTGEERAITALPCNNIEPAWEADSETLLYASDCGRGLWLTALCRRHVVFGNTQ